MSVAFKLSHLSDGSTIDCVALDTALLNRNTFGDAVLRAEIIGLFLSQLDGVRRSLSLHFDQTSWHFLCHTLKGAAASVGANQIAVMAENWSKTQAPTTAHQRKALAEHLSALVADFRAAAQL